MFANWPPFFMSQYVSNQQTHLRYGAVNNTTLPRPLLVTRGMPEKAFLFPTKLSRFYLCQVGERTLYTWRNIARNERNVMSIECIYNIECIGGIRDAPDALSLFLISWHVSALDHDDVIKWKHFPRYWPFVRGIHRSPVNSPYKGQWRGTMMFHWSASE